MDVADLDRDTWMEINTFECPRGMGRLSPESCAELRNRQPLNKVGGAPHPQGREKHYRPGPCTRCTEYQQLWDEVARRRADSKRQQEGENMGTLIDCLGCGAEDVENQGRGLCKQCYPRTPAEQRGKYQLEDAKRRRGVRLEAEGALDVGDGLQLEPTGGDDLQGEQKAEPQDKKGQPDSSGDLLAGFEFVPCSNTQGKTAEVNIDSPGKFLRFGSKVVQDLELTPGTHVHVYAKEGDLALKVLPEPDRLSFKLSRDGSAKQGPNSKVALSARRLVKNGWVRPGQRFEASRKQNILFLSAIEEEN